MAAACQTERSTERDGERLANDSNSMLIHTSNLFRQVESHSRREAKSETRVCTRITNRKATRDGYTIREEVLLSRFALERKEGRGAAGRVRLISSRLAC